MNKRIDADTSIDLHLHTIYSDGRWSAEQLLDHLTQEGFGLIAVTDHDRVDTVASIQELGREKGITVLAAVEISAAWHGQMADVLCYGFNPHDEGLRAIADRVRQGQKDNAEVVYEELLRRGYEFPRRQEVLKTKEHSGNAHIAKDQQVTFFDFDCSGPGWRAYDLAVFRWARATHQLSLHARSGSMAST